jgi:glycosyltransferase involved in cell wall biosynthesis
MPFHETRGGNPDADRLLLISDQFPPAQSAGALRWQKLARYAADRGWALDVITRDPAHLSTSDDARLAELPPGTRVYAFSPHALLIDRLETWMARAYRAVQVERAPAAPPVERAAGRGGGAQHTESSVAPEDIRWQPASPRFWMRSYWALVDHRRQLAWARDVERVGRRVLDRATHRAVISCGPWHLCNHEAARRLARRARLPFIMDLRDPWSLPRRINEPIATPVWFSLARHYESRAVHDAALVVVNAEPVERAMRERYPAAADRMMTVTNGYDDDPMPASRHGGRFTIAYAGGIYLDRDPRPLFQAASRVIASLGLQPDEFGIVMIGNVDDYGGVPLGRMAEEEGIGPYVHTGPLRPRTEALELLAGATVLLSLPQDSPWAIPSKIFEYMQFDAWMLVMAEPDAPAALLLQGTTADVVAPSDVEGMARVLRERYEQFARGERPTRLSHERRFSRRHQAERLMDAIARSVSPRRQAEPAAGARPLARVVAEDAAR